MYSVVLRGNFYNERELNWNKALLLAANVSAQNDGASVTVADTSGNRMSFTVQVKPSRWNPKNWLG